MSSKTPKTPKHAVKAAPATEKLNTAQEAQIEELINELFEGGNQDTDDNTRDVQA